ncbi:MAG: response regulator transcription factor, partial [Melioribacteraceae bacterium]
MINVIVVEDKDFIREGLEDLLNVSDGFVCGGAFPNCELMLEKIESIDVDVIIMDIGLPGMSGIEGTKLVKKILPQVDVVVLTVHEENEKIFEALISGASGYLLKTTPHQELLLCIQDAYDGGSPMNSKIAKKMIELLRALDEQKKVTSELLSERENEVLSDLAEGQSYREIAENLFISSHTVRYHIRNIYDKLNVNT